MASVKTTTTTVKESSTTTRRYVTENRTQRHFLRRYSLPSSEIQRFHTEHLADGNSHPVEETQTCSIEYNPDTGTQTKRTKTTTRRVRRTVTQGTSPPQVQNLGRSFYVLPIGQSPSPGVFKTGPTSNLQTSLSENVQERYYTLPLQRDSTTAAPYSQGQGIFDVNIPVRLVERRMSLPSSQIIQKITETRKTYTTNISDSLSSFPKRPPEALKFQIVPIDFEDGPGLYPTPPGKPDQPNLIPVFSKSPGPTPAGTEVPPKTDTKGVDGVKVQEPLLINMKPIAEDEIFPSPQKAQWVPAEPGKKRPDASKSGQQPPDKQPETKQPPNVTEKDLKGKPEMLKESEPMRFCVEPFVHEESFPVPQKIQFGSDKPGFESDFPEPQQASLTRHCDIPKKAQQPSKKPISGLESPATRKPDTKSPSTVSPGSGAPDYDWIPYSGHPDVPISTKSMEIPVWSRPQSEVKPSQPEKGRQKPDQRAGQPVPPFDDEFPTPQRLIASFEPDKPDKGTGRPKEGRDYQRPSPKSEGQVPQVISLATFPGEPISSEEAPQSVPQEIRIIHQDGRPGHPTPRDRSHPGEQVGGVPDITERNRPQGITQKSRKSDIPSASPYDRKNEPQMVNIIHQDMSPDRYPHFGPTDKRPGPQAVTIVYQDMNPAGHPYSGPTNRKPESQPVHIIHQEDYPDGHPYSGPVRNPEPQPGNIIGPDMKASPRGPGKAVPKLVRQPRVYEGIGQVPGQKGKGMPTPRDRKEQSFIPPGGEVLEPQQVIVVASALPLKPQDTPRKPQGDRSRPGTDGDDELPAPQKANVMYQIVTPEIGHPRDRKYLPGDREPGYQRKPEMDEYGESPVPQKHMVSYKDMAPEPRTLDKGKGKPQGPQSDIPVVDRRLKNDDDDEFPMPQRANVMYQDITPERKRPGDRQRKPQDKRPEDGKNEFPTPQRANRIYQVVTPEPQNTRVKQRIPVDKGVGSDDDSFPIPQKATIAYQDITPESGKPTGKESRTQGGKPDAGNEEYPTPQKPFVTYQDTTPNVDKQGRHQVKRPHKYTPGSEEDDEFPIPRVAAVLYQDITPESRTQRDRRDGGQVRPQDDRAYGKGKPEKDDDFSTPRVATVTNQIIISEPPGTGPERFPADRLGPGEEYLPQHRQDGKRSRPQGHPSKGQRSPENDDEFPTPQKAVILYQDVTPELPRKRPESPYTDSPGFGDDAFPSPQKASILYQDVTPEPRKPRDRKGESRGFRPPTGRENEFPTPQKATVSYQDMTPEAGIPDDKRYGKGDSHPTKRPGTDNDMFPTPQKVTVLYQDVTPEPYRQRDQQRRPQDEKQRPSHSDRPRPDDNFPTSYNETVLYQDVSPEPRKPRDQHGRPQNDRPGRGDDEFPTPQKVTVLYQDVTPEPRRPRDQKGKPQDDRKRPDDRDDEFPTPQKVTILYQDITPEPGRPRDQQRRPQDDRQGPDKRDDEFPTPQKVTVLYQDVTPEPRRPRDKQRRPQDDRKRPDDRDDEFPTPQKVTVLYQDVSPEPKRPREGNIQMDKKTPVNEDKYLDKNPQKTSFPGSAESEPVGYSVSPYICEQSFPRPQRAKQSYEGRPDKVPDYSPTKKGFDEEFPVPQRAMTAYELPSAGNQPQPTAQPTGAKERRRHRPGEDTTPEGNRKGRRGRPEDKTQEVDREGRYHRPDDDKTPEGDREGRRHRLEDDRTPEDDRDRRRLRPGENRTPEGNREGRQRKPDEDKATNDEFPTPQRAIITYQDVTPESKEPRTRQDRKQGDKPDKDDKFPTPQKPSVIYQDITPEQGKPGKSAPESDKPRSRHGTPRVEKPDPGPQGDSSIPVRYTVPVSDTTTSPAEPKQGKWEQRDPVKFIVMPSARDRSPSPIPSGQPVSTYLYERPVGSVPGDDQEGDSEQPPQGSGVRLPQDTPFVYRYYPGDNVEPQRGSEGERVPVAAHYKDGGKFPPESPDGYYPGDEAGPQKGSEGEKMVPVGEARKREPRRRRTRPTQGAPAGEGKKKSQVSVGTSSDISLDIKDVDISTLTANIISPSGKEQPCILKRLPNGHLGISFTPQEKGDHKVNVYKNGQPIRNSPFIISVGEKELGNASRVKVSGKGLEEGMANEVNQFTVNTKDAGYGGLSLSIEGPSKADIDCQDTPDGNCLVSYKPTEPGTYIINIKFADEHVPGSPFAVKIRGEPSDKLVEKIMRQAQAVDVTHVGSQCELSLKIPGSSPVDMNASVTSPSGVTELCEIIDLDDCHYSIKFVPKEMGVHTVSVKHKDMHIPGSPFQFTVGPITEGGSHKVHAAGPGLEKGEVNEKCEFNIYTREAGAGGLSIAIEGPSKAEIDFADRKDGSCGVSYECTEPGEYMVSIKFNDEHIPDSPFKVYMSASSGEAKTVTVASLEQAGLVIGKPSTFSVNLNEAKVGRLEARVTAPSGAEDNAFIQEIDEGHYAVRFIPRENGRHYIHVLYNGNHIPGSPFVVMVGKLDADPGMVQAYGQGLVKGETSKVAKFIVNTMNAGAGALSVTIDGPSKVDLQCKEVEEGYEFSYTPTSPGGYLIAIKFAGNYHIVGSPFKANITGPGQPSQVTEHTSMRMETTTKTGADRLRIPHFPSDANKVTAKGNGLKKAMVNKKAQFSVDTKDAGQNMLFVGVMGPKGVAPCEEINIRLTGRNTYTVNYSVKEKGQYLLMVKWGEDHIPGSPFTIDVI